MQETDYYRYIEKEEQNYETLCRRCGACCGAYDDPCVHLKRDKDGRYFCEIYHSRFGEHTTVGGTKFFCVPIREILHQHWPGDYRCSYKRRNFLL